MIKLPRGNTLNLTVRLKDSDGKPYTIGEKDHAVFTVKYNDDWNEKPIVQKIIRHWDCGANGELQVKLDPQDTVALKTGFYLYDIAVCLGGRDFYTTVVADTFQILPALSDMGVGKYGGN